MIFKSFSTNIQLNTLQLGLYMFQTPNQIFLIPKPNQVLLTTPENESVLRLPNQAEMGVHNKTVKPKVRWLMKWKSIWL